MTLNQGKKGRKFKILNVNCCTNRISRRFLELGFNVGQTVKIIETSFSKKVYLVEIRGYVLSVRASLLNVIEVQEC